MIITEEWKAGVSHHGAGKDVLFVCSVRREMTSEMCTLSGQTFENDGPVLSARLHQLKSVLSTKGTVLSEYTTRQEKLNHLLYPV